jgi:hypothetical protein
MPTQTPDIQYYFKETTNQILVSGSSPINTQLESIKDPTTVFDQNYTAKISSLGANMSYVVQNGVEFTNLILNNNLTYPSQTTTSTTTVTLPKNGSKKGINGEFQISSAGTNINEIIVVNTGSGYQVGETITFTQSELLSEGFTGISGDIIITLSINNIVESSTIIPLESDQELWVYRGYNTSSGDGNTYRYNPHLHRPYKAYIVTETGSGIPTSAFIPVGGPIRNTSINSNIDIPSFFLEGTLASLGNGVLNGTPQINIAVSGSFQVFHEQMSVYPWVFTQYTSLPSPPALGAQWRLYLENAEVSSSNYEFNTTTTLAPGNSKISYNSSTIASVTEVKVGPETALYDTLITLSNSVTTYGKEPGMIKIQQTSESTNFILFGIDAVVATSSSPLTVDFYVELTVSNAIIGSGYTSLNNDEPLEITLSEFSELKNNLFQQQTSGVNFSPQVYQNNTLINGIYTYTSSIVPPFGTNTNGNNAIGTTQFGLCTALNYFVTYKASHNLQLGNPPIDILFSASDATITPTTFTLDSGYGAEFNALAGSPSAAGFDIEPDGTYSSPTLNIEIINTNVVTNFLPPNLFSTRWKDTYISYSESISSSLDGLYIFNQLPQNDVEVTASMFLTSWTGSDTSGAQYAAAIYGTNSYGEGDTGGGPTWPTASIRIYTGSYPNSIPSIGDAFAVEEVFQNSDIHVNGLAITMSYLIPSQSINIRDCLSLALQVSSGSANPSSVENSLVVQNYQLEFNVQASPLEGDGLVPTFIENAFEGTNGFSKALDCQPFLNNVNEERENKDIQIVNYSTGIYKPSNFELIISGSARKSTVPLSNYTQLASINNKYVGSRSTAQDFNVAVEQDSTEYTYGNVPVVDYQNAFFAYCEQITDPYPVINDKIQFNIKYLINAGGDVNNPNLSPYTAFDIEGTWVETTDPLSKQYGKVGMNQQGGVTSYNILNGEQEIEKVAKQLVPVLYSQTSSNGYQSFIPIKGTTIPEYKPAFTNYAMTFRGPLNKSSSFNSKAITLDNFMGSSNNAASNLTSGIIYDPNFTSSISSSIVSSSVSYASLGEVYFSADSDSDYNVPDLSAPYTIELTTTFPTTPPQQYRTSTGNIFSRSSFNGGKVGEFSISMEKNSGSSFVAIPIQQISPPTLTLHYTGGNTLTLDLFTIYGSSNVGLINNNKTYRINMMANLTRDAATQLGQDAYGAIYATLNLGIKNADSEVIQSETRYRFKVQQSYLTESVDPPRNYWNPTNRPIFQGSAVISPPQNGPFVGLTINPNLTDPGQSESAGSMTVPFWTFPTSSTSEFPDSSLNSQIELSNLTLVSGVTQPVGNEFYNKGNIQQSLVYNPGPSTRFPGGFEPADTTMPNFNIEWKVEEGDQIRFINSEDQVYNILSVIPPTERSNRQLLLLLDREVPASIDKDFFLLRRWIFEPSSIIINKEFPYAELPIKKEFRPNVNLITTNTPIGSTGNDATGSTTTQEQSGSMVTVYNPLLKKNNTPSGFLFPPFPIPEIELTPDKVMSALRDNKLID